MATFRMILQDFGHVGSVCVCGVPLRDSFNGIKQTLAWSKINAWNADSVKTLMGYLGGIMGYLDLGIPTYFVL